MSIIKKSILVSLFSSAILPTAVHSKEIQTNTAIMQAMDKVTGRVKVIEVPVNGNVDFGSFSILVRDCQTRPPEETPENYAFVDILDTNIDGSTQNIFRGWMMSSSTALNAVEHPIYDVWLLKCVDKEVDPSLLLTEEQLMERNAIERKEDTKTKFKEDTIPDTIKTELELKLEEEKKTYELKEGILETETVVIGLVPDTISTTPQASEQDILIDNYLKTYDSEISEIID